MTKAKDLIEVNINRQCHETRVVMSHKRGTKKGSQSDSISSPNAVIEAKPQAKKPNFYRVLLLNDDYTPMDFVILVLTSFFRKSREEATRIMLNVHQNGIGECGTFTYEVAETKVMQVMDFARQNQHPLQCVMEKK